MAKYGYTLYGLHRYGELDGNQVFYQSDITALTFTYGSVFLSWTAVNPDPADPSPTHYKVVRSQTGTPDHPELGLTITGGPMTQFRVSYTDITAGDVAGQEVYYSLWIFNGLDWIFCGETTAIVSAITTSLTDITRRLPAVWMNDTQGIGDVTGEVETTNQLVQFLDGMVFEYDRMRLQTELLAKASDYRYMPKALLPLAIVNMGMPYEPTLGDYTHRSLYRVGHVVNGTKGASHSVSAFTSGLTHWGSQVTLGHNLFLDYNDSSFEETVGRWSISNGTIQRVKFTDSATATGTAFVAPVPTMVNTKYAPRAIGFAYVKSTASGNMVLQNPTSDLIKYGIPVDPNSPYAFRGYIKSIEGSAVTMTAQISYYDRFGVLISTTSPSSTAVTSSNWALFDAHSVSPANAVYAGVKVTIPASAANKKYALDMLQFGDPITAEQYEDARTVHIQVGGDRVNYLPNPGFDLGVGGWVGYNADLAVDFASPTSSRVYGTAVARVKPSAASAAVISEYLHVSSGAPFTFSAYVSGTAGRKAVARIEFTTQQGAAQQISILSDDYGQYFPRTPEIVDSAEFTLTGDAQLVSVTAQSPTYVSDNGIAMAKVSIYFPDATAADTFYVDACLLEQSPLARPFFQGSGAPIPTNPVTQDFISTNDCQWEWREQINLVNNPSFDTTTGWTANSGTTISSVASGGGITPYAGSAMLKLARTTAGTATVSTTITLDELAVIDYGNKGGRDYALSIRVAGFTGTVSIGSEGQETKSFTIDSSNSSAWTTISAIRTTLPSETSFTLTISATPSTSGAFSFYVDGAQVEQGRTPGQYVSTTLTGVTTRPNRGDTSKVVWEYFGPQVGGGGRSYYWARYTNKLRRLEGTISNFMPMGSTWDIVSGEKTPLDVSFPGSILTSSSFEYGLDGWSGDNSTLSRQVAKGSHFSEYAVNGQAWANVTSTGSASYGVVSDAAGVALNAGYYVSAAIKPTSNSVGDYTLMVKWFDSLGAELWRTSVTKTFTSTDRWNYIALTDKNVHRLSSSVVQAASASLTITCEPRSPSVGSTFGVDRVLFRQ